MIKRMMLGAEETLLDSRYEIRPGDLIRRGNVPRAWRVHQVRHQQHGTSITDLSSARNLTIDPLDSVWLIERDPEKADQ